MQHNKSYTVSIDALGCTFTKDFTTPSSGSLYVPITMPPVPHQPGTINVTAYTAIGRNNFTPTPPTDPYTLNYSLERTDSPDPIWFGSYTMPQYEGGPSITRWVSLAFCQAYVDGIPIGYQWQPGGSSISLGLGHPPIDCNDFGGSPFINQQEVTGAWDYNCNPLYFGSDEDVNIGPTEFGGRGAIFSE